MCILIGDCYPVWFNKRTYFIDIKFSTMIVPYKYKWKHKIYFRSH